MKQQPYQRETTPKRNDKCPCGSGKKSKRCCLSRLKLLASLPPNVRAAVIAESLLSKSISTEDV